MLLEVIAFEMESKTRCYNREAIVLIIVPLYSINIDNNFNNNDQNCVVNSDLLFVHLMLITILIFLSLFPT